MHIREWATQYGWGATSHLARACGVPISTIHRLMNGQTTNARTKTLKLIKAATMGLVSEIEDIEPLADQAPYRYEAASERRRKKGNGEP